MADIITSQRSIISALPNGSYTSGTVTPTGADISVYEGNFLVGVDVGVTDAGTVTFSVQHNTAQGSADGGWAAIPADALVDPTTGGSAAFDAVTATGGVQYLEVVRHRLKRYARVVAVCAGGTYEASAVFTGFLKY